MANQSEASVVSLQLCVGHREPMQVMESVRLETGFGIEGDLHATRTGARVNRQVLLMDEETLESFGLAHGQIRKNVTTTGIQLATLEAGTRLALGNQVVLRITGHCEPCSFIDEIRQGLREELDLKRGMLAFVVSGGTINVGDPIRVLQPVKAE